ncbi:urokinase plasminogen activator surface receptor isoform X1 [Fukomys damarensis]|uniref:Urokinase plasminogen activator surface receptor n=1 Tax=Fukomys damarensis TaxID=885580 RepID=A0A091DN99_FUKDA|nr:urokinase plasminogen activator surface receptor isoform X1 [Fukomys damarensis]KFO33614.1 Urokinase plasminogen activator surface receptor [Fukomys damarensis]
MGRTLLLPLCLLICTPAYWALLCFQCKSSGPCQVEECAPGQDLCRITVMHVWEEDELEVVERGCAHAEKTNRTMSYRVGPQIISLTETVCGSNMCNRPRPGRARTFAMGRYLECISCTSSDLSCERGREQSLQCRHPREQCLEVVTHSSLEENEMEEHHTRGCGFLPGCPGPTGFHSNHSFHYLRCCNSTKCNSGPVIELQHLPPNGVQCYSCEGNGTHGCSSSESSLVSCRGPMDRCLQATGVKGPGNMNFTVRGCATASWCQDSHMADTFSLTHLSVSCCKGTGCNNPASNVQYRSGGTSQSGPDALSLVSTLLVIIRLWGGVLLWI